MKNKNNENNNQNYKQIINSIKNPIFVLERSKKRPDLQNITISQEKNYQINKYRHLIKYKYQMIPRVFKIIYGYFFRKPALEYSFRKLKENDAKLKLIEYTHLLFNCCKNKIFKICQIQLNKWNDKTKKLLIDNKKNQFLNNYIIKKHNDYLNRYLNKWKLNGLFWPRRNKGLEKIYDIIQEKIKERKKEIFMLIKNYRNINFLSLEIKKRILPYSYNGNRNNISKYFYRWKNNLIKIAYKNIQKRIFVKNISKQKKNNNLELVKKYLNKWKYFLGYNKSLISGISIRDALIKNKKFLMKGIYIRNIILRQFLKIWKSKIKTEILFYKQNNILKKLISKRNKSFIHYFLKKYFYIWKKNFNYLSSFEKFLLKYYHKKHKNEVETLIKCLKNWIKIKNKITKHCSIVIIQKYFRMKLSKQKLSKLKNQKTILYNRLFILHNFSKINLINIMIKWRNISKKIRANELVFIIQNYIKKNYNIRKIKQKKELILNKILTSLNNLGELYINHLKHFFLYEIMKNNKMIMLKTLINKNLIEKVKKRILTQFFKLMKLKTLYNEVNKIRKIQINYRKYKYNKNNKKKSLLKKCFERKENKNKKNNILLLSLKLIQFKNKSKILKYYIPSNKIQKVFRGYFSRKNVLPKIKEFNNNLNIQKMKLIKRTLKIFPILNRIDNYLNRFFNKWRYEALLNPFLIIIKNKINTDSILYKKILKYKINKWKIISTKLKYYEKANIMKKFFQNIIIKHKEKLKKEKLLIIVNTKLEKMKKNPYYLKIFFNKFLNQIRKDKNIAINNIKNNLIKNQLEKCIKILDNHIKNIIILIFNIIKGFSLIKKRNEIISNLLTKSIKETNEKKTLSHFFNLLHIKMNKMKLKENSILISNFMREKFDNFKTLQNKIRWKKFIQYYATYNKYKNRIILFKSARLPYLFNKRNKIKKQKIIYPPLKKLFVKNIYKIYTYKVLSKVFQTLNNHLRIFTFSSFYEIKKLSIENSKYHYNKDILFHEKTPHLFKFTFKYSSKKKDKKINNNFYIQRIIPFFVKYVNNNRKIILNDELNNILKISNNHLFITKIKKYINKKLEKFKRELYINLKDKLLLEKLYSLIKLKVLQKLKIKFQKIKRTSKILYLVKLIKFHKYIVKRKLLLNIIRRWILHVKIKLLKEKYLEKMEVNFVETYERIVDGIFGDNEYELSIQKQIQEYMDKTIYNNKVYYIDNDNSKK